VGYAVQNLLQLRALLQSEGMTGRRVADLGSQDVTIADQTDVDNLIDFVRRFGGDVTRLSKSVDGRLLPTTIPARDVFSCAGFAYVCCDVDRRPGTIHVDFNSLAFDRTWYDKFDLVMNAGTIEHLANPAAAFFFMHHLCRAGGVLFNEVPFSGWTNHGLCNLTAKFWHSLQWMNSYRVLSATIKSVPAQHPDEGNFNGEHLAFITDLDEAARASSSIEIVFQKTDDRGFVPPYDAVFPTDDTGAALAALIMGSLRPFVESGALREAEAFATTNQFLDYQGLEYRFGRLDRYLPANMRDSAVVDFIRRNLVPARRRAHAGL
jgi:SAM-dependent methyltransferase